MKKNIVLASLLIAAGQLCGAQNRLQSLQDKSVASIVKHLKSGRLTVPEVERRISAQNYLELAIKKQLLNDTPYQFSQTFQCYTDYVTSAQFSLDVNSIVTASWGGTVKVWYDTLGQVVRDGSFKALSIGKAVDLHKEARKNRWFNERNVTFAGIIIVGVLGYAAWKFETVKYL